MTSSLSHHMQDRCFAAVVPAAGVGKRMLANHPKQYLMLHGKTILEHTIERLLSHPLIDLVIVAISDDDEYFPALSLASRQDVIRVSGGKERVDSVLSGLEYLSLHYATKYPWVLVHDAARPCVTHHDISQLVAACCPALSKVSSVCGGILASPVRDTMKKAQANIDDFSHEVRINTTVDRNQLWHALTPQMFPLHELKQALSYGLLNGITLTDEASAMEAIGQSPLLVTGRADNIKVTQPEDLALAEFFLYKQMNDLDLERSIDPSGNNKGSL